MRDFVFEYGVEILLALITSTIIISFIYFVISDIKQRVIKYSKWYFVYSGILFFVGIFIGTVFGFFHIPLIKSHGAFRPKTFWQVWDSIANDHYKSIDRKKMFYNALKGVAYSAEDKYTHFLTPEEYAASEKYLPGNEIWGYGFDCEGCYQITPAGLEILEVFYNSPAAKLNIGPGDIINSIDGCDIGELTDKLIEPGEHIFTITKFFTNELVKLILAPEKFKIKGVAYWVSDEGVAYIQISNFEGDVAKEFEEAVEEILKKEPKGLILDLRNNLGGKIEILQKVADAWLPNKVIQIDRYLNGKEKKQFSIKTKISGKLSSIKTVVLINENTASASEVLTGALKYYFKETRLVGERTYGKTVTCNNLCFNDGSCLRYTIHEWLNPGHIKYNKGIKPDYEVEWKKDSLKDYQLDKAMTLF